MNMRTTLMLLAATVVPAFAQQPAAPASQELVQMAAPAQAPAATPEQRAAAFSALAVLPAELSDFIVLSDIAGTASRFAGSGIVPELEVSDLDKEILALDGIAIGSARANAASFTALSNIMARVYTMQQTEALAQCWVHAAAESAAVTIRDAALQHNNRELNEAVALMDKVVIHPVYGVVTCKPGNEGMLQEWYAQALGAIQAEAGREDGFEVVENIQGFSGIKIDLSKVIDTQRDLPAEYLEYVKDDPEYLIGTAAEKEAATRTIYVLLKQQGNALVSVICEDPAEIKLAASPAESVLGTNMVAEADANLSKGMIALLHYSPEILNGSNMLSADNLNGLSSAICSIFNALGDKDAAHKATYDKAGAGVKTIFAEIAPWFSQGQKPSTMQIWCDSDFHIQASGDARGMSFTSAPLRHSDKMDAPSTILYSANSPYTGGPAMPSLHTIMDAALDISKGIYLTLPAEDKAKAAQGIQLATVFMPEAKAVTGALGTIASGLDGNCAMVVDSTTATLAPVFGAQPGTVASVPRVALSFGVNDRSKLSTGWEQLVASVNQIATKMGGEPATAGTLPISAKTEGAVTSYNLALPLPLFNEDFVPTLSVSDNALVAGTSAKFNSELMQPATETTNFAGGVFVFRPAPMAAALGSLADALDEKPEAAAAQPQPTPTVVEVEVEEDGDVDVDIEDEDDYDEDYEEDFEDYDIVAPRSPQQRAADNFRTASRVFEECGRVVDSIYAATTTTADGRVIFRLDAKLK